MKKAKKAERTGPSATSLRDIPELDFGQYGPPRPNPYARRMHEHGWELVHDGPSAASLRDVPEIDVARGAARANPHARRIKAEGFELQVGRGRPRANAEVGPTEVKSVRLPPALWAQLEARARAEGVALHALVRAALAALLTEKPARKKRSA
jgi:hypothetical protein